MNQSFFYVRKNQRFEQVLFSELIFVKAMRGYMQVVTESTVYFVLNTIEEVQKYLPAEFFCRTHRSYIVSIARIKSFNDHNLQLRPVADTGDFTPPLAKLTELPVGKMFRKNVRDSVRIIPNRLGQKSKNMKKAEFMLSLELEDVQV